MLLEQFKLETNPFSPGQVRPRFQSEACRKAAVKLERVLDQSLYCLFLSGRAGVGKSSLVEHQLKGQNGLTVSLIGPAVTTTEQFLSKVLGDVGLPAIDATASERRNILEVFLRHETSKGKRIVLVADALERLAEPVLKELETLMRLRYKNRPVMGFILLTRSEELVNELASSVDSTPLAPHAHERLAGFSLDETGEYVAACLLSVGGQDVHRLFPEDVLRDVHAYTQGIVGDVNKLCFEALGMLAEGAGGNGLDTALIERAGERLNLTFDPAFRRELEGKLSPDAIHQSDPSELEIQTAHLLVASRGEVVAEISLNRPRMVLGRDHNCDISLDSSYVSRYQNLFMETPNGWLLIDLSSTNGCFVNGRRVTHHELQDGDIIAVGHHQISFVGSGGRKPATRSDVPASVDTLVSPKPIGKAESA